MRTVGWIGLGIMGRPMAGHLIDAGYDLLFHDKFPISADLASRGKIVASPREIAEQSDRSDNGS
jgi:2-hydroxy-3-oxopropionate reductase